jgi:hypothetical protein
MLVGDEGVVGEGRPACQGAATVRGLPDAAADGSDIGDDRAVHGRRGVEDDGIDASLRRRVVEAAGAAGHALGLRAEGGEAAGVESQRGVGAEKGRTARGDGALDQGIPGGRLAPRPGRTACRIAHAVAQ